MIATLLVLAGFALLLVGAIAFLIAAFRESVLWGLAVLFLPGIVSLIFLILHWDRAKDSFFLQLYGIGAIFVAVLLANNNLPWPLG